MKKMLIVSALTLLLVVACKDSKSCPAKEETATEQVNQ